MPHLGLPEILPILNVKNFSANSVLQSEAIPVLDHILVKSLVTSHWRQQTDRWCHLPELSCRRLASHASTCSRRGSRWRRTHSFVLLHGFH